MPASVPASNSPSPTPPSGGPSAARNWLVIGVVLIGGLLYLAFNHRGAATTPAAIAADGAVPVFEAGNVQGRPAPNWTLEDLNGKPVSLSQYKGHPVVLDFWATWCGPCQIELPWWREFQKKYAARGLVIVGVSEDSNLEVVQKYAVQNPFDYLIVWDNGKSGIDSTYGTLLGVPTTLFIDRDGKIAKRVVGLEGKPDLDADINSIL